MVATTLKEVSVHMDTAFRLNCALGAYTELLKGDTDADGALGRSIRISLESIDPSIDLKEGSYITLRMIKENVVKVGKATREMLRVLFEIVGNLYVKFTGSLGRVRGHQKAASKRLARLGGRVTYKQMEISGINRLSINGTFVGDDPQVLLAIAQVSDHLLNKHPATVVKVARVMARRFVDLTEANPDAPAAQVARQGMGIFQAVMEEQFKAPNGARSVSNSELSGTWASGQLMRGEVMPGNWALVYTNLDKALSPDNAKRPDLYANLIKQAFEIDFVELTMNTADRAARTVDVPSVATLAKLIDGVSSVLSIAEKAESGRRDFASVKTVVDDAIRQVMDVKDGKGVSNTTVIQMLGSVSEVLAAPMENFTHWVAVTMNVYLNYIDHCIKHYEADGL